MTGEYGTGYSFNDRRIKFFQKRRRRRRIAAALVAYYLGVCNTCNLDQLFTSAASTCPALSDALPNVSGKNILKGLAMSESGLHSYARSQPGFDGSYSYGIMQINTSAHPYYPSMLLRADTGLNIRVGAADLCEKLQRYGNLNDAVAHYKGWYGYRSCPEAKQQTDTAIDLMERQE